MDNLVIYRKYRPKSFSEIAGQEHVVKTLTNALSMGIISHAYLFTGPRGSGKTTIARLLAKAFNCLERKEGDFEPCNRCESCLDIMSNRAIDLIEIDAASYGRIDEMRELKEGIKFAPNKSKYKVFIIDESHQLSKEAANALLKTLEEPPAHAIFILATTEIQKIIPTIISRCQRFDFRKLTNPEIIKRLEMISSKEKVKIAKPALELIAFNSGGAMRDAESLLGQVLSLGGENKAEVGVEDVKNLLGLVETNAANEFAFLLADKKTKESLEFLNSIGEKGSDLREFAKFFVSYLRQILLIKISGDDKLVSGFTKEEIVKLNELAGKLSGKELYKAIDLFLEAENKMKYASIQQLPLELAAVEFCEE